MFISQLKSLRASGTLFILAETVFNLIEDSLQTIKQGFNFIKQPARKEIRY